MAYASQIVRKGRSSQKKVKSKTVKKTKSKTVKKTKSKPVKKTKSKTKSKPVKKTKSKTKSKPVKKNKSKSSKKTVKKKSSKKVSKAKQQGGIVDFVGDFAYALPNHASTPNGSQGSKKKPKPPTPKIQTKTVSIEGQTFYFKGTKEAVSGIGREKTRYFYLIPIIETTTKELTSVKINSSESMIKVIQRNNPSEFSKIMRGETNKPEETKPEKQYTIIDQIKKLNIYSCEDPNKQCTPKDKVYKLYEIDPTKSIESDDKTKTIKFTRYHSENELIIKNIEEIKTNEIDYNKLKTNTHNEPNHSNKKYEYKEKNVNFDDLVGRINNFKKLQLTENIYYGGISYTEKIESDLERKMKRTFSNNQQILII